MASRPRKVTEMSASWRSARSTAATIRRTVARESGSLRPLTSTSFTLNRLEFRCDAAAGAGITDALVVGARHDPGKLALDAVEVAQRERCVIQLARTQLLLYQMLDRAAHRFGRGIGQDAYRCLGRVGQHRNSGLGRLRPRPGIPEIGGIHPAFRIAAPRSAQKVRNVCSSMMFWNKGFHHLRQGGGFG